MIAFSWIAVAALTRFLERTWWSPGSFLALILSVNALGTIILAPEYHMSVTANLYLQVLVTVTSVGAMIGRRMTNETREAVSPDIFIIRKKVGFFLLGLISAVVSALFTLKTTGVELGQLTSPVAVMRAAQRITFQRYTQGLNFPIFYNISNAIVLSYSIATAVHFVAIKRVEWKLTIPFIIVLASNMLITSRAPILFMIWPMIFAAVYVAMLIKPGYEYISLTNRMVVRAALSLMVFVAAIFFAFQVLRFGEESTRSAGDVWAHLKRYPWGSLPGFSAWFDGAGETDVKNTPGFYTFMGIYDNLGIAERQHLAYTDYISLARGEPANVYTAFRGLYHDFGPLGSGVFLFIVGLVGGAVARGTLRRPYIGLAIYASIMTFVGHAFVVSSWAYTSNIAAVAVLPIMLKYFTVSSERLIPTETVITRYA